MSYTCNRCGKTMVSMCEFREHWSKIYCNSCFNQIESSSTEDSPIILASALNRKHPPKIKENTIRKKKKRHSRETEEYLKRILWVEDNERDFDYFFVSRHLKHKYAFIRASDFFDALHKINDGTFDLYLINVILPISHLEKRRNVNYGIELIKEIRKQNHKLPIIVLSECCDTLSILSKIKEIDQNIVCLKYYGFDEIIKFINKTLYVSKL